MKMAGDLVCAVVCFLMCWELGAAKVVHITSGPQCVVPTNVRVNCGWKKITPAQCENNGCCFNNKVNQVIWCYKPVEPPTTTTPEPTTTTPEPTTTTPEPTTTTPEPTTTTPEPTTTTPEPTTTTPEPTTTTPEPTTTTPEPTTTTPEPTTTTPEPTTTTPEPTTTTPEPTTTPEQSGLPCVCVVEAEEAPMVKAYDGQLMPILSEQKTLLSNGKNPDIYDRCRFQVRTVTNDDFHGNSVPVYIDWVAFSFGIHPNPEKGNERAVQIKQDTFLVRGPGAHGENVPLDWQYTTFNNPGGMQPLKVSVKETGNIVTLTSDICPWKLEFTRGGMNSTIKISVGARFKPENNSGQVMRGMCGDCNDVMDDYKLCDDDRTDVWNLQNKFPLISDSCAKGEHQHQD